MTLPLYSVNAAFGAQHDEKSKRYNCLTWQLMLMMVLWFTQRGRRVQKHFLFLQANNTQLTRKEREMWNITTKALLHLGAVLVVDVFFHYLYILTIPSDMKLVTKLTDWCLGEAAAHAVFIQLCLLKGQSTIQNWLYCQPRLVVLFSNLDCFSVETVAVERPALPRV